MAGALSGSATILAATGVVANGSLYLSSYTTSGEVYAMQNSKWVKIKVDGSQA